MYYICYKFYVYHVSIQNRRLVTDQAREHQLQEEEERLKREAEEAERKLKEEEVTLARAAHKAAVKKAALVRRRREKAMSLGAEPDKVSDSYTSKCHRTLYFPNLNIPEVILVEAVYRR